MNTSELNRLGSVKALQSKSCRSVLMTKTGAGMTLRTSDILTLFTEGPAVEEITTRHHLSNKPTHSILSPALYEAASAVFDPFELWVQSLVLVTDRVEKELNIVSLANHLQAGLDVVDVFLQDVNSYHLPVHSGHHHGVHSNVTAPV